MTPADYCDAMARWWRDASAGDPPVASETTMTEAIGEYREEFRKANSAAVITLATCNEHHAAAWTSAATRLRAHALHAAADAAEETTR